MSKVKKRSRNFLITLNQVEKFDIVKGYLQHFKTFQYAIATKEKAPTTGHEHIHIYCQFDNPIILKQENICQAHIDHCYGSAQQNIDYIKKKNEPEKKGVIIWEEGKPKFKGGVTISDVKGMSRQERENLPFVYYKAVEKLNSEEIMHIGIEDAFKHVDVRFIYGKSGFGKTTLALKWAEEMGYKYYDAVCYVNGFWNGVSDACELAIYDDFRDSDLPAVEFIKFIDYTVKILNVKGSYIKNRYKCIFITSIQDPSFMFGKEFEEAKQWLRRMKVYQFTNPKDYKEIKFNE